MLCDTNGGTLPSEVAAIVRETRRHVQAPLGIHAHNDGECAVANSLAAVVEGAEQVQGTLNGFGERCGNANLVSIIPNLMLKLGLQAIPEAHLRELRDVARFAFELANRTPWQSQPFVGDSAFAHKAGMHVSAILKHPETYEHMTPDLVGNHRRVLVSELSGQSNILWKAREYGIDLDKDTPEARRILETLKRLEDEGYQFEGAEASFELLMERALGNHRPYFELEGYRATVETRRDDAEPLVEATVRLRVKGIPEHTAAAGNGPVNALDHALRKALEEFYPNLREMHLVDYKVRILDESSGTAAKTRVLITSGDGEETWGTVGVAHNIIDASWQALVDSVEYKEHQRMPRTHRALEADQPAVLVDLPPWLTAVEIVVGIEGVLLSSGGRGHRALPVGGRDRLRSLDRAADVVAIETHRGLVQLVDDDLRHSHPLLNGEWRVARRVADPDGRRPEPAGLEPDTHRMRVALARIRALERDLDHVAVGYHQPVPECGPARTRPAGGGRDRR